MNIVVPEEDFLVKTAGVIKTTWEAAGAEVSINVFSIKDIQEKVLKNTDYEMLAFGNIVGGSGDLFSFWHSTRRFYPDQNLSLYQNKKADILLEKFRKDLDPKERIGNLKTLSDMIAADYPAVFLYSPDYIYVSKPSLKGFDDTITVSSQSDRFQDIEKWYLKTTREF